MEELIGQIDCGSKSDSIVLRILRSAMDRAQEKLRHFKDGPIEYLHEQTTFYELAGILVEGCLKIVEDDELKIFGSGDKKILSDLIEIRQRLVGRIRDMKQLIKEKYRELRERLGNESRLHEGLDQLRERQSAQMYEKIETGVMKTEGDSYISMDTIDMQKVLNINQKLDTKRRARRLRASCPNLLARSLSKELGLVPLEDGKTVLNTERRVRRSHSVPNLSPKSLDKEQGIVLLDDESRANLSLSSLYNERVENDEFMSSHIDILKQTLDLVLGRMQPMEVLPLEKEWRRGIERKVESISFKGFVHDLRTKFEIEIKKRDELVKDSWFDFIDEIKSLLKELKDFFSRHDLSNMQSYRRASSEPDLDDFNIAQNLLHNEDDDDEEVLGSPRVWEIVKSHESIIRNQREQWNVRLLSWIKRNEDICAMERLIQDAIVRLENFTQRKHKVSDLKGVGRRNKAREKRKRVPKPHSGIDRTSTTIQSFEAEIKKLQEERDGLCLQISVIEDTYQLLFCGLMKDFSIGSCRWKEEETASDEEEGSYTNDILICYMECRIKEDIFFLVLQETVKQWKMSRSDSIRSSEKPQEDFRCSPVLQDCTECLLREEIYKIYFKETTEEWRSEALKRLASDVSTHQSKVTTLQEEIVEESKISQLDSTRGSKAPQEDFRCSHTQDCTECLLREDIYKVYLREMTKGWRSQESKQYDFELPRPPSQRAQEGAPHSRRVDGESSLNSKVDSLLKSLEREEDLVQTASSLIKQSVNNSLAIRDTEEMEERNPIEQLITDDESTLICSVSEKLERALQQLCMSKELLAELEEGLEFPDGCGEYSENSQFKNILHIQEENKSSELKLEGGVGQTDWSENVLAIIKKFRFLVDDVEVELHENLESKFLRLEALKRQVDSLSQPVAWIRTRKLLYENAFISRCRNLKLAETEVDLLGDQVEALLSLLERIYFALSRDAKVLSNYFEVNDILKLIKIELSGGESSEGMAENRQKQNLE